MFKKIYMASLRKDLLSTDYLNLNHLRVRHNRLCVIEIVLQVLVHRLFPT